MTAPDLDFAAIERDLEACVANPDDVGAGVRRALRTPDHEAYAFWARDRIAELEARTPDPEVVEVLRPFATALERYRLTEYDMIYLAHEKQGNLNVLCFSAFNRARALLAKLEGER